MNGRNFKSVVRKVEDLKPYDRNSRTHNEAQVAQLAESIKEFGFTNPALIDEQDTIIAGEGYAPCLVPHQHIGACPPACPSALTSALVINRYLCKTYALLLAPDFTTSLSSSSVFNQNTPPSNQSASSKSRTSDSSASSVMGSVVPIRDSLSLITKPVFSCTASTNRFASARLRTMKPSCIRSGTMPSAASTDSITSITCRSSRAKTAIRCLLLDSALGISLPSLNSASPLFTVSSFSTADHIDLTFCLKALTNGSAFSRSMTSASKPTMRYVARL
jgi:hypothetical protein